MILGADPAPTTALDRAMYGPAAAAVAAARAAGKPATLEVPPVTAALLGFILPGAVLTLVKRERHPFIWWAFGVIPIAWSAGRLLLAVGTKVEKQ